MELLYAICRVAIAPLRAEPSDKAEICSQVLFGEHVEILEQKDKWWNIRNAADGYEGWLDPKQFKMITHEAFIETDRPHSYLVPPIIGATVLNNGSSYYLSPGSDLPYYHDGHCLLGNQKFEIAFEPRVISDQPIAPGGASVLEDALFFLNAPYLWGGKSLFGIDCSGLVQIVFKLNGVKLKRDAWQQAEQGKSVDFLVTALPGDVAFFDNDDGRIIHVGILLNNSEIIHASGQVRVDHIDNQGIYNQEQGRYTHKLRIIKRYI